MSWFSTDGYRSEEEIPPCEQAYHQVACCFLSSIVGANPFCRLNSTLSIRIEELNAEITILQVENLRLRQSEITLQAQLKREREKTRRVITDTEAAVRSLDLFFGSFHS
jgi:hypothetical protein